MSAIVTNKALATAFIQAIAQADMPSFERLAHDDLQYWIAGKGGGSRFDKMALRGIVPTFPAMFEGSFRIEPTGVTAEGDRVAVEAVSHGTLRGGRRYDNRYHILATIKDGRIWRYNEYHDTQHAFETFGDILSDPA